MKRTLLAFLLLSQIAPSFAQEEEKIVYVHTNRGPRNEREYKTVNVTNVYKFDPVQMLTGQILFGIEHYMSEKSTIEFEVGPTISNVGINIGHLGSNSSGDSRMGIASTLAFRYYPSDDTPAPNKFYVGPKIEFRNYNYLYQATDMYGEPISGQYKGYENYFRFMFNFGKQYWLSSTFSMDVYGGLGIGNISSKSSQVSHEYNYQTQTYEDVVVTRYNTDAMVMAEFGVKFGIGQ